jgi:DNA-binding transcriptional ArsR family regulator
MSANSKLEIKAINDALSATFAALADPTRRAMLVRLSQGEASVNELAAPFDMSLPAVSKHIKVLEKAGLLTKTKSAQQRPCKIDGVQLKQAVDWIDQYKQLWETRFDRMDAYLKVLHASETADMSKITETAGKSAKPINRNTKITTKSIATQAVNTSATGKKMPKTRTQPPTKEKNDDNAPNHLQQQIGFDF